MTTKHTPANWVRFDNRYGSYVREASGNVIAQMVDDFSRNEKENHAKLIAAAPDLLEALIEMESMVNKSVSKLENYGIPEWSKALVNSQQAIEKATQ